jgi:hypothetical protein
MKWQCLVIVALAASLSHASPGPASDAAPPTICNDMSVGKLYVAYGYYSTGVKDAANSNTLTGPFVSRGFLAIDPGGKCETIENTFHARYVFWWATDGQTINRGRDDVWETNGSDHFCVVETFRPPGERIPAFTFEDENVSATTCANSKAEGRSNVWIGARMIDVMVNPVAHFTGVGKEYHSKLR